MSIDEHYRDVTHEENCEVCLFAEADVLPERLRVSLGRLWHKAWFVWIVVGLALWIAYMLFVAGIYTIVGGL